MKVLVYGTGYVGLVTGVCLANYGHKVVCLDIDKEKIYKLGNGKMPFYEPGLEEMLQKNRENGRLDFTNRLHSLDSFQVVFIAVGTPQKENGEANLRYVEEVAQEIGSMLRKEIVIIIKSTVPVGTSKKVHDIIDKAKNISVFEEDVKVHIVSNPEFLREGCAVYDFEHPDKIVIGSKKGPDGEFAREMMRNLYSSIKLRDDLYIEVKNETAELIKYACNAFLASKVAFINEMAQLCNETGADVQNIAKAMGADGRISSKFLNPGPGYGGSCFPKDVLALDYISKLNGLDLPIISSINRSNKKHIETTVARIIKIVAIGGMKVAVLGLSFKPETDDVRESPAIEIINQLLRKGVTVNATCPKGIPGAKVVLNNMEEYYQKSLNFFYDVYREIYEADAIVLVTEWKEYRALDFDEVKRIMNGNIIFDLRNVYAKNSFVRKHFKYFGMGT